MSDGGQRGHNHEGPTHFQVLMQVLNEAHRLHGLAQTHFVGQDDVAMLVMRVNQKIHTLALVISQLWIQHTKHDFSKLSK
jgi:hypothetical protein